jgi:hypothetical protein
MPASLTLRARRASCLPAAVHVARPAEVLAELALERCSQARVDDWPNRRLRPATSASGQNREQRCAQKRGHEEQAAQDARARRASPRSGHGAFALSSRPRAGSVPGDAGNWFMASSPDTWRQAAAVPRGLCVLRSPSGPMPGGPSAAGRPAGPACARRAMCLLCHQNLTEGGAISRLWRLFWLITRAQMAAEYCPEARNVAYPRRANGFGGPRRRRT